MVHTRGGRVEVPVPALMQLYERIVEGRDRGARAGHPLEAAFAEGRERASRMSVEDLVTEGTSAANGHERPDVRSLAYHRAVGARLDREMVGEALHRIWKWREEGKLDSTYADRWEELLDDGVDEVRRSMTGEDAFVVIGSQAILGPNPDAPRALLRSVEVDLFPRRDPGRAIEIDASLGDGSPFHEAFGYYAHGVGPETANAPQGWLDRLIAVEIPPRMGSERGPVAHCHEPHDLILAKCVAGRDRDWGFAREALGAAIVSPVTLMVRVDDLHVERSYRDLICHRLEAMV